jgi:hypothetical protein
VRIWPTETSGILAKKYGPSIREATIPAGFILTPSDISTICNPRKYQIVIYADATNYYVAKITASPEKAIKYGECVNGKTGVVTHPKEKNRYSLVHITPYEESPKHIK